MLSHNLQWPPFRLRDNLPARPLHASNIHASWLILSLSSHNNRTLFRYSSTPLVPTPSADSTSCPFRWIGFDRALCLGYRRAVLFFIVLTFSDRILCTISARRYNPQRRHSVSSPYSPNPRSYHASCFAPRVGRVFFFILRLSSHANFLFTFSPLRRSPHNFRLRRS
jgi:hypothetical protein